MTASLDKALSSLQEYNSNYDSDYEINKTRLTDTFDIVLNPNYSLCSRIIHYLFGSRQENQTISKVVTAYTTYINNDAKTDLHQKDHKRLIEAKGGLEKLKAKSESDDKLKIEGMITLLQGAIDHQSRSTSSNIAHAAGKKFERTMTTLGNGLQQVTETVTVTAVKVETWGQMAKRWCGFGSPPAEPSQDLVADNGFAGNTRRLVQAQQRKLDYSNG